MVVSNRSKLYHFCSTGSLDKLLHRYHNHSEGREDERSGVNAEKTSNPKGKGFLMIRELREQAKRVGQPDADQLNISDLVHLAEQLEDALSLVRSKKRRGLMQSITDLTETEKMLTEENRHLQEKITEIKNTVVNVKKKGITMELLAARPWQDQPVALKFL